MLNLYELEIYVQDYHKERTQSREAELKRLLSQVEPEQRIRKKLRMPDFVSAWLCSLRMAISLQKCPELA